jgi:hypothetical protein
MKKKKRNWMAARFMLLLSAIVALIVSGCDSNPPGSACLESGNPWCSNYVPPGSGGSTSDGGAGTGGNTNVQCGALPQFNCFGSCVILTSDEANCGSCGRACDDGQTCNDGHCAWNQPPDQCTPSAEVCDGIDNDCNGVIDQNTDLFTDPANCGTCGRACADGQSCNSGHCAWDSQQNGCQPSTEVCNQIDDDCDSAIDEPFNLLADVDNCGICGHACAALQSCNNGHCTWDTEQNGCQNVAETCNNVDDDCDFTIDNGFNLLTDAQNCGTCGHACAALQYCNNGHCAWNNPQDDCVQNGAEICNNIDEDCDGEIDEGFNLLSDPANCGTCGRACDPLAVCQNAVCKFTVPQDECVQGPVELCNSRDDNCNGFVDEGFNLLTDKLNCGQCGRDCGAGTVCDNGHCQLITPVLNCGASIELCNYTDDDCDGEIDELINLLTDEANCGVCGLDCGPLRVCDSGHCQWIDQQSGCVNAPETCNGVDDDCDSVIDDGYSLLNDPANCGMCGRACALNQHCENGACAWDFPQNGCTPGPEVCDNIDNNCNKQIDEGFNLQTDPANCGVCGHVCPAGQVCDLGHCEWIQPQNGCTPAPETCNNEDDDCDNVIDEGYVLSNDPLNCGICGHVCAGGQICTNGHCAWNSPQNGCVSAPETCDNIDNDCDLGIDEGFNLSIDSANCGICGYVCGLNQYCLNGHCANNTPVNVCNPVGETCNNTDDNCNGQVDEGINLTNDPANCGTCGRVCAPGQHCQNSTCAWIVPQNSCTPAPEACDNNDNDCDTLIDEGYDLQHDAANCGICGHACAGGQHCTGGACAWDIPQNGCTPALEACNNIDDDCDSSIDEGYVLGSDPANCGTCGHSCAGGQVCMNGHCAWTIPQNGCQAAVEVCDNIDNDCDTLIDEGINLLSDNVNCGQCGRVCAPNQHCQGGACAWNAPQSGCISGPEMCDNLDNDCDLLIDEGYNLLGDKLNCGQCGRVCAANQYCENGFCTWITAVNLCGPPSSEICDNADNDCDDQIDEDFNLALDDLNCGTCGHACAPGQHCASGACAWDVPQNGCISSPELCDGEDNDCNGSIDEGYSLLNNAANCGTCGNACAAGQFCSNGHCKWNVLPNGCVSAPEVCDGIDNDCDYVIDESFNLQSDPSNCGTCGRVCGAGLICQSGHCQYTVPPSQCTPVNETCNGNDDDCDWVIDDGYNLLTNNANCGMCGHACAGGQHCQSGHCQWDQPQSQCAPVAESCNQIDDDCDGLIDELWNFLTDKTHCGNCYTVCPGTQNCLNGHCYQP